MRARKSFTRWRRTLSCRYCAPTGDAAKSIGWLHRATTKAEWTLLALAAFACFLPLDARIIDAAPGYAINVGGWLLLAAVSLWQKKTLRN